MPCHIRPAGAGDLERVLALLTDSGLPLDGLSEPLATAIVAADDGGKIVGCAALEVYFDGGLLRALAVAPEWRGRGIGQALSTMAIEQVRNRRLPAVYLLTTTAAAFFPKLGFETIRRDDVPPGVRTSVEFTSACPSSAAVMRLRLTAGPFQVRPATDADLQPLTDIYNHYVVNTPVTFDVQPFAAEQRRPWFDEHSASGRHRLFVAVDDRGACAGYATSSPWRPKPAYGTTVEASVYCRADVVGRGCGSALYAALFASLAAEDVRRIVAGITLPNAASVALHERFGFKPVGVFHAVGRKFDQYWDVAWFERPANPDPG